MSSIITCYVLFDITNTGVLNRQRPENTENIKEWSIKRNTQCNFDTILQSISLRSQPEEISKPEKIYIRFDEFKNFGLFYQQSEEETYPCWKFTFAVQHNSVFANEDSPLGALFDDCHGVPMIKCGTEWDKLPDFLDTSVELKNIYFIQNES